MLARVSELVFGAADPKAGAVGSLYDLAREPRLNHRVEATAGVLADPCGDLLRTFFRAARARSRGSGDVASLRAASGGVT